MCTLAGEHFNAWNGNRKQRIVAASLAVIAVHVIIIHKIKPEWLDYAVITEVIIGLTTIFVMLLYGTQKCKAFFAMILSI